MASSHIIHRLQSYFPQAWVAALCKALSPSLSASSGQLWKVIFRFVGVRDLNFGVRDLIFGVRTLKKQWIWPVSSFSLKESFWRARCVDIQPLFWKWKKHCKKNLREKKLAPRPGAAGCCRHLDCHMIWVSTCKSFMSWKTFNVLAKVPFLDDTFMRLRKMTLLWSRRWRTGSGERREWVAEGTQT